MRPHDTGQEAHEFQIRDYRRMDAEQKAELVADLSEAVRDVAREGIRQ
jgi:phenylpyruvate tautomerase PptA (4-oxalocrotonate tautomerase family)